MKYLILFILFFFAYGIILSQFHVQVLPAELAHENPSGFYDYKGITHAHSSINKGSREPEFIIKSAQEINLDFLFFTEFNSFDRRPIKDGYYNELLVIGADEVSYIDSHILYYRKKDGHKMTGLGDATTTVSDFLSKKTSETREQGFLVLGHPYFKDYVSFKEPYPEGLNGIEVLNLKSVWNEAWRTTRWSFFWSVFVYPFNPEYALIRIYKNPDRELALWDRLNKKRPVIGYAGNDSTAKALPMPSGVFRFPSYKRSFQIASNHLLLKSELTGDLVRDREKVLNALQNGQFYMSFDLLANPKGFNTFIQDGDFQHVLGSKIPFRKGMKIRVELPEKPLLPFEVAIYKDGKGFAGTNSKSTTIEIVEPGTYRVQVRVIPTFPLPDGKRWIPWIYSNPFFIE